MYVTFVQPSVNSFFISIFIWQLATEKEITGPDKLSYYKIIKIINITIIYDIL